MRIAIVLLVCASTFADIAPPPTIDCALAPDKDMEGVCNMMVKCDEGARQKVLRRRQAVFTNPISVISAEDCKDLQCFCAHIGNRPGCNQKAYRREYRMLSDAERQRYNNAIATLKRSGEYDRLSDFHRVVSKDSGAHSGPGFLPWHREYLKRVELALRSIDPSVSIPYWDSVMDSYLPNVRDSIMFHQNFMGDTDAAGQVTHGSFAWFRTLEGKPAIVRALGVEGKMFNESSIANVLNQNDVRDLLAFTVPRQGCPFSPNFHAIEYAHAYVHLFVGGDMKPPVTSANDPIFFLHHCMVDFIWEMWRQLRQTRAQREGQYPPDIDTCTNSLHFSYAQMKPWNMQNREGTANYYTDNFYSYAPRPSCSAAHPHCGSPFIFCDTRGFPHCVAKIKLGGLCSGFEGFDACYQGICTGGRCVPGQFGPKVNDEAEEQEILAGEEVVGTDLQTAHQPPVSEEVDETTTTTTTTTTHATTTEHIPETTTTTHWPPFIPPHPMTTTHRPFIPPTPPHTTTTHRLPWTTTTRPRLTTTGHWVRVGGKWQWFGPPRRTVRPTTTTTPTTTAPTTTTTTVVPVAPNNDNDTSPQAELINHLQQQQRQQQLHHQQQLQQQHQHQQQHNQPHPQFSDSQCYNDDPCCEPWSHSGECQANTRYMSRFCRRSCHFCHNPTDAQNGCVDRHPSCAFWRQANYCVVRRPWMSENCQRSCGLCRFSKQQLCDQSRILKRRQRQPQRQSRRHAPRRRRQG